jgi:hypothetical protein
LISVRTFFAMSVRKDGIRSRESRPREDP